MGDKSLFASAGSGDGGSGQVFYKYTGPDGRLVITDSPPTGAPVGSGPADVVVLEPPPPKSVLSGLEMRSLWLGVVIGVAAAVLLSWVIRIMPKMVGRILLGAAAAAIIGLGYLGWMRRSAGLSQDLTATPQALVDDAKRAVEQMNARMRQQDEEIKKIQNDSRK